MIFAPWAFLYRLQSHTTPVCICPVRGSYTNEFSLLSISYRLLVTIPNKWETNVMERNDGRIKDMVDKSRRETCGCWGRGGGRRGRRNMRKSKGTKFVGMKSYKWRAVLGVGDGGVPPSFHSGLKLNLWDFFFLILQYEQTSQAQPTSLSFIPARKIQFTLEDELLWVWYRVFIGRLNVVRASTVWYFDSVTFLHRLLFIYILTITCALYYFLVEAYYKLIPFDLFVLTLIIGSDF